MRENFLLSICIPTRNRGDVLEKSLYSIIENKYFEESIQIVISNNASDDGTENIVLKFRKEYPENIVYLKQDNVLQAEENFVKVLEAGSGSFLKLSNDYSIYTKEGLCFLIDFIKLNMEEKPLLFFSNGNVAGQEEYTVYDINTFAHSLVHTMTWIGCYGFWNKDYNTLIEDKLKHKDTLFMQIYWIYELLLKRRKCIITNKVISERASFNKPQGGYNLIKVQLVNFLNVQKEQVQLNQMSSATYKYIVLKSFMSTHYFLINLMSIEKTSFSYNMRNALYYIFGVYKKYWFFYVLCLEYWIINALMLLKFKRISNYIKRKCEKVYIKAIDQKCLDLSLKI